MVKSLNKSPKTQKIQVSVSKRKVWPSNESDNGFLLTSVAKKTHLLKVRLLPHPFLCSVFYKVSGVLQVNCQNFCFKGHIWPIELCYIVHLFICFHQPNKTMEVQPPGQIPFEIQLFCFVFCHRIWRTCQNWKNLHQVSCWILQPYCARATIEPRTQTLLLSIILVG